MRIGVVIRTERYWTMTRFKNSAALLRFISEVREEIPNIIDINLVNLDPNHSEEPPVDFAVNKKDHIYWCPWCQEPRKFESLPDYEDGLFCEICHISTNDFWISYHNHLRDMRPTGPKHFGSKARVRHQKKRIIIRKRGEEDE